MQVAAVIHFIRRRPDGWWLWIILFQGPIGALVYLCVEAIPDAGLLRGTFQAFPRRQNIARLETAIRDNPSAANSIWWWTSPITAKSSGSMALYYEEQIHDGDRIANLPLPAEKGQQFRWVAARHPPLPNSARDERNGDNIRDHRKPPPTEDMAAHPFQAPHLRAAIDSRGRGHRGGPSADY